MFLMSPRGGRPGPPLRCAPARGPQVRARGTGRGPQVRARGTGRGPQVRARGTGRGPQVRARAWDGGRRSGRGARRSGQRLHKDCPERDENRLQQCVAFDSVCAAAVAYFAAS